MSGPDWARGKSRDQLIREMDDFYAALPHLDLSPSAPRQPEQPAYSNGHVAEPTGHTAPMTTTLPPDPSLAQTDPERWQKEFDAYNRSLMQGLLSEAAGTYSRPLLEQNAQTARELSMRDPRNDEIWRRYGPEIDREMARVPVADRTKRAYDEMVVYVKGRHFDDLLRERTQAAPAAKPNGSASASEAAPATTDNDGSRSPIDELWDSNHFYIRRMKDSGLSKTALKEKVRAMGLTEKQWAEGLEGKTVVTTPAGGQQVAAGE